jgi:F-type H+-transporting ATPase subunit delta
MNSGLIATRYATALFSFANENNNSDRIYEEAKTLRNVYFQVKQFRIVIENPVLPKSEKRKLILSAVGGKVSTSLQQFIDLLLNNNRETFLQSIVLKYIDLYRKDKNIHYGKLTTAFEIDKLIEKKLIAMVEKETGGTVEMEKVIDASILGGFLFEVDFKRWDASIKGQLNFIRKEYIEKNLKSV